MSCGMGLQDAGCDAGDSVLCWQAECHSIPIKLALQAEVPAGVWQWFDLHGDSKHKQLLPSLLGSWAAKARGEFCQSPK